MLDNGKVKVAVFAALTTLSVLLFIQAFIFPVVDEAVFYLQFAIEYYLAPVGPLHYSIHNRDNVTHTVYIEISKAESEEVIYKANHTIGPKGWIRSEPITDEPGKYRVKVVVDGKAKDEKCICIKKFTGGVHVEINRLDGNLTVYISQGTA